MADCVPDRNTDYATIYRDVISKRCGTAGTGCHGAVDARGDLALADADTAYNALLGLDGTDARVVPGDPGCSELMERLDSDTTGIRMPLGEDKLSEGVRCAIRTWIQEGAAR